MITIKQQILNKLRAQLHVSFISEELLKLPINQTQDLIEDLVSEGLVDNLGDGYYILKKKV